VEVSVAKLQELFNAADFDKLIAAGQVYIDVLKSHDAPAKANQPAGTLSQMIAYRERKSGDQLASAHRYLRPDGTLGASGKPDPKSLMVNGVLHTAWWGTKIGGL
jgi:hypothetical protein